MSEDVLQVRVVKILGIENTCICMLKFSPFSKLGLKQQLFQNNLGDLHFKEDTQHSCTYLKYIITESNLFHMFCFVVIWFWTTNNILHESYNLQTEETAITDHWECWKNLQTHYWCSLCSLWAGCLIIMVYEYLMIGSQNKMLPHNKDN